MRRLYAVVAAMVLATSNLVAAESGDKEFKFDLYGFVRSDLFYNDRASFAPVNELFYMYPYDENLDPNGEDINDTSSAGFFSIISRMGVNISGPSIGAAETTAKIEIDFGGFGAYNTILRIRQAYINMAWENGHTLIIGQTWDPLFGEVMPTMTDISVGAPFQPFSRSPQLRYQYRTGGLKLIAAALCQLQYTSNGPSGSTNAYMINSTIPELFVGADYYAGDFMFGFGADLLHITPRTVSATGYKVDELMAAYTGEVHMRYQSGRLRVALKSVLGSALDSHLMVGGYGVTSESTATGEWEYTPFYDSSSWLSVSYGEKWRPHFFVGYTKNLGTTEALLSADKVYGFGVGSTLDSDTTSNDAIDQLLGVMIGFTYNRSRWSAGIEYASTTAWYGDLVLSTGRVTNTHDITSGRIAGNVSYNF
ncbi:MAG: hypothetical protein SNG73_06550 [Rikenellaceae bacterium]